MDSNQDKNHNGHTCVELYTSYNMKLSLRNTPALLCLFTDISSENMKKISVKSIEIHRKIFVHVICVLPSLLLCVLSRKIIEVLSAVLKPG